MIDDPVYVLVSDSDCVQVLGVYTTLETAQQDGEADAEQAIVWHQLNRGEASHIIPPFNFWHSEGVRIEGEDITYTITKCPVRETVRP